MAYGWSSSRSRFFWGFRLLLLCAPDGMPIGFELVPANVSERRAAAEILERIPLAGHTFVADKGFAGHEFEALVDALGGRLLRPDRKNEPRHRGALGGVRQLDRVDHRHLQGPAGASRGTDAARLMARIAQRLLGLAATVRHNQLAGRWDRSLVAYDH